MGDRVQRLLDGREGDRRPGVGVHDAADVRPRGHHLAVDRKLAVAGPLAGQHRALAVDQHQVVAGDLLQAQPGGLHPEAAASRVTHRHVAPDHVTLPFGSQDPARRHQPVEQRFQ